MRFLMSRVLAPTVATMHDHVESTSTSSATLGFVCTASLATQSCSVDMKLRAQPLDTLAFVYVQCINTPQRSLGCRVLIGTTQQRLQLDWNAMQILLYCLGLFSTVFYCGATTYMIEAGK